MLLFYVLLLCVFCGHVLYCHYHVLLIVDIHVYMLTVVAFVSCKCYMTLMMQGCHNKIINVYGRKKLLQIFRVSHEKLLHHFKFSVPHNHIMYILQLPVEVPPPHATHCPPPLDEAIPLELYEMCLAPQTTVQDEEHALNMQTEETKVYI